MLGKRKVLILFSFKYKSTKWIQRVESSSPSTDEFYFISSNINYIIFSNLRFNLSKHNESNVYFFVNYTTHFLTFLRKELI